MYIESHTISGRKRLWFLCKLLGVASEFLLYSEAGAAACLLGLKSSFDSSGGFVGRHGSTSKQPGRIGTEAGGKLPS